MNRSDIIKQIDQRVFDFKEYDSFQTLKNRLMKIRGKLLHCEMLSKNDIATLKSENFYLG